MCVCVAHSENRCRAFSPLYAFQSRDDGEWRELLVALRKAKKKQKGDECAHARLPLSPSLENVESVRKTFSRSGRGGEDS